VDLSQKVSRRSALKGIGAAAGAAAMLPIATGALGASRGAQRTSAGRRFQQAGYEGVTLRVLNQAGTAYEPALARFAEEFKAETGATVEFDPTPWESMLTKAQANVAAGGGQYDIFIGDVEFQYTLYPSLMPINDMITASGYSLDGLFAPTLKYGEGIGGQAGVRYGLPVTTSVSPIFYRTDLIPEFPTTWADYERVLADLKATMPAPLAFAGAPAQLVKLFLARYWSQGDPLLTTDWKPLINSEKGVAALESLISFKDPDVSKIGDTWAVAPYPEGGTGNMVQHNGIIFNTSKNGQAAFDYLAYVTGDKGALATLVDFHEDSAREALWSDPSVVAADPWRPDFAVVVNNGKPFTPGLPQWLDLFIAVAEGVSAAMAGTATPKDALDQMAAKWEASIQQAVPAWEYVE
jgi:ABC-type glycerol-3-phosphate transport system substrate-binding protein